MSTRLRRDETPAAVAGCPSGMACLCDSVRPRRRSDKRPPAQDQKDIPAPAVLARPARLREPGVRRRQQLELPDLDVGDAAIPVKELRGKAGRGRAPVRRRSPVAQPPLEDLLEEARSSSRLEGFARRMWAALRLMVLTVTLGLALSAALGAGVFGLYRLALGSR